MEEQIAQIRRHSRHLVRELDMLKGVFQDSGCTYSECHALFELKHAGTLGTNELADILCLDKSTTSRILQGLKKKALINEEIDGTDRRQKRYSLLDNGLTMLHKNNKLANEQVSAAIEYLLPDEIRQIERGLKSYAKALRQIRLQQNFNIRLIEKQDNPQVAKIIRSVMTEFGAVGEGYSINDPEVDDMYTAYSDPTARFYVIEQNGKILGCGGIGPLTGSKESICELKKMYFLPDLRGLGFGRRLLSICLKQAKSLGYLQCYLETIERMWQANLLYKKMGFTLLKGPLGCTGHSSCDSWYVIQL